VAAAAARAAQGVPVRSARESVGILGTHRSRDLARQADAALADGTAASGRGGKWVVKELLRLVTVDEQGRPTRWRIPRNELPAPVATELDAVVARRC
jgi:hypothetical protein